MSPMHVEPTPGTTDTADLRQMPSARAADTAPLRAGIAARLSRVRGDLSSEAFDALVDDICAMKVRWARELRRDD